MLKGEFVILAVSYTALSRLSEFSLVACGHKVWLGVEPIWLIDVINSDRPVTIVLSRNVFRGIVVTTDHFIAL